MNIDDELNKASSRLLRIADMRLSYALLFKKAKAHEVEGGHCVYSDDIPEEEHMKNAAKLAHNICELPIELQDKILERIQKIVLAHR